LLSLFFIRSQRVYLKILGGAVALKERGDTDLIGGVRAVVAPLRRSSPINLSIVKFSPATVNIRLTIAAREGALK